MEGTTPSDPTSPRDGGYDTGYRSCPCFWGREPGSVLRWLADTIDLSQADVLDLGCGEGKNAVWLARMGCAVTAVDVSRQALSNAREAWPESNVNWVQADVADFEMSHCAYDLVIAYGLCHCLKAHEVPLVLESIQASTKLGGANIVVAFNDRHQDLSAHSGFNPTLFTHEYYVSSYGGWEVMLATDEDLSEIHPHNNILHTHSMTRIAARRPNA
jgi:cyclopropane fatty-acyl-phospholipid synthase-like methyltransferase